MNKRPSDPGSRSSRKKRRVEDRSLDPEPGPSSSLDPESDSSLHLDSGLGPSQISEPGASSSQISDLGPSSLDQPSLTQESSHSRASEPSNSCAEDYTKSGAVKKMVLKNFMCHSNLEVDFNLKINFIIGRNGSGKSAILTALIVGLGGKTAVTNRSNCLKGLIKSGESSASVQITLHNAGKYTFKREVYGDSIIITRLLGTQSGYRIKSARGEIISTKKEELERIITTLGIQVENPLTVLTQDTSRTFMNLTSDSDKFKFFKEASRLKELDTLLQDINSQKTQTYTIIHVKSQTLNVVEQEVQELEKKFKIRESLKEYEKNITTLENELYWSHVVSEERKQAAFEKELEKEESTLSTLKASSEKKAKRKTNIQEKIQDLENKIQDKQARIAALQEEESAGRNELRQRTEHYKVTLNQYTELGQSVRQYNTNLVKLQVESAKINNREQWEKAQEDIKTIKLERRKTEQIMSTTRQHMEQLNGNRNNLLEKITSLKMEIDHCQRKIISENTRLQNYRAAKDNSVHVFGPEASKVVKRINEEYAKGKFRQKPRGPIGSYIQVKDKAWTVGIENHLKASLKGYIVSCYEDGQVLKKIFSEIYRGHEPLFSTCQFFNTVHNVEKNRVVSNQFPTIFDTLTITDTVVCNYLIDNHNIESTILVPTTEEGCRVMSSAANVPKNCLKAITKKGDIFFPVPNYKTYSGTNNPNARYLQVSLENAMRQAEQEIIASQGQQQQIHTQINNIRTELSQTEAELKMTKEQFIALQRKDAKFAEDLDMLNQIEEPQSEDSLSQEIEEFKQKLATLTQDEAKYEEETQAAKRNLNEWKNKVTKLKEDAEHLYNEKHNLETEKQRFQSSLDDINDSVDTEEKKCRERSRKIALLQAEYEKQIKIAEIAKSSALKICPPIETDRSEDRIQKDINEMKRYIETAEKQTEVPDIEVYYEKYKKYTDMIRELKIFSSTISKLDTILKKRQQLRVKLMRYISASTSHVFHRLLHERNFEGKILLDPKEETLKISVIPYNRVGGATDTRNLSGGERSYSTVAFLLALSRMVTSPFFFLDEFDVFMDITNRHVALSMLLHTAKELKDTQFVLLTPQDISGVKPEPYIKFHKMLEPRKRRN